MPGRKSKVKRETMLLTSEQAAWRLSNWKTMIHNYRRMGYSYPTISRIKKAIKHISITGGKLKKNQELNSVQRYRVDLSTLLCLTIGQPIILLSDESHSSPVSFHKSWIFPNSTKFYPELLLN